MRQLWGIQKGVQMSTTTVHIEIDADELSPLRRIWRYIGYDEPNYTYTKKGRELLEKLGAMADSPYYIRCHFLLCTGDGSGRPKWGSTNVYTEDTSGNPVYCWEIIDRIFDTYVSTGCIPFVEIGFMPLALTSAPDDVPYDAIRDAGWGYPPVDYSRWADLIRALARHCLNRYGLGEVSRWYWELWNEPDIFYWQGSMREYCRLFDYTETALHSVIPQAKLGGPAVTSPGRPEAGDFLRSFLGHCAGGENSATGNIGVRLDFITFHTKGASYRTDQNAGKQTPSIRTLLGHVEAGLRIVDEFPVFNRLEINLSECDPDGWAAGGKHDNPNLIFRNTEYYASFLASTVCKLADYRIDGMVTWAFQFEGREYFEGLRSLSTNGIDKPVLNVFRMLARLGGMRLASSCGREKPEQENGFEVSSIAAKDQSGTIRLFLASHHDDWDQSAAQKINIRIKGLEKDCSYTVTGLQISGRDANSHHAWIEMGEPQRPSAEQLRELKDASGLRLHRHPDISAGGSGEAECELLLEGHSVYLLELVRRSGL